MLNVFRTVGEDEQPAESARESDVVDLPKVIGSDEVCSDSFGRLLPLEDSWLGPLDIGAGAAGFTNISKDGSNSCCGDEGEDETEVGAVVGGVVGAKELIESAGVEALSDEESESGDWI